MYQIHCLNKISPVGTGRFGDTYTVGAELANADAVLVRSAAMHDMELPESLLAIARAGAAAAAQNDDDQNPPDTAAVSTEEAIVVTHKVNPP